MRLNIKTFFGFAWVKTMIICVALINTTAVNGQNDKQTINDLTNIEINWQHAYVVHDSSILNDILSDDFLLVGNKGGRIGKEVVLKRFSEDKSVYEYSTPYNMQFRIFGDCVIVLGNSKEKGVSDGKPFEATWFFQDIFIRKDGKWKCVQASDTKIESK